MDSCHMDNSRNLILFNIIYGDAEVKLCFGKYETVGDLKEEIMRKLDIPRSKQVIDSWYRSPQDDNDLLASCCDSEISYLVVYNSDKLEKMEDNPATTSQMSQEEIKVLQERASLDFITYFFDNFDNRGIMLHVCQLNDAITQACFTSLSSKKILLLYLHNKNNKFAKIFCENLVRKEVKEIVNKSFFLLGWDVENEDYHKALIDALNSRTELTTLAKFVKTKLCAALLIVPIKNSFIIVSCMKGKISEKDFQDTLQEAEKFFLKENQIEQDLEEQKQSGNEMGSINYQQMMLDMLGDRDYDSFDYFEFDELKKKIGYALYGPPVSEDGSYEEKEMKKIEFLFKIIVKQNNQFNKWKDRIIISFIYNCIEPLPSEKKKRQQKFKDYNPVTDLIPCPLFVLFKCTNSLDPCRVIIDDGGRVYLSWASYLKENKLHECEMILPLNGRYQSDAQGAVLLERHMSPACGIDSKILQGLDLTNTAAGLVSGGIFVAAAIPAVAVAPVALVAAGATGIGVGLYSLGRSAYTLYDRYRHHETLNFANSEARGAYVNIVAGSLGFVGAGANVAVTQLAARGMNVGQGATATVNAINMINLGASGASVVNSSYDVFDQWLNENKAPSILTLVQLGSSILFFGHAVYSYRSIGPMVEESQAQYLREYQDSLRSNRHRKTFNKMLKETIRQQDGNVQRGQAEVIRTLKNIQNRDEVFATLTRANKRMNQDGVKFMANGGEVRLNGVSIDLAKFGRMDRAESAAFLSTLPATPEPSPTQVRVMTSRVQSAFGLQTRELVFLAIDLAKIFSNTDEDITERIINAVVHVAKVLEKSHNSCFLELGRFFANDRLFKLVGMVNGYFQELIDEKEQKYQKWLATQAPEFQEPIFPRLALDFGKRTVQLFNVVSKEYFRQNRLTEEGTNKLIEYFTTWFAKQALDFQEKRERKEKREKHSGTPRKKVNCPDCGGVYYAQ